MPTLWEVFQEELTPITCDCGSSTELFELGGSTICMECLQDEYEQENGLTNEERNR